MQREGRNSTLHLEFSVQYHLILSRHQRQDSPQGIKIISQQSAGESSEVSIGHRQPQKQNRKERASIQSAGIIHQGVGLQPKIQKEVGQKTGQKPEDVHISAQRV